MPVLSLDAKNLALNAITIAACSLHDNYSPNGEFEIDRYDDPLTPVYSRLVPLMNAADNALTTSQAQIVFGVPANVTVRFMGMWDGAGIFLGMMPVGGLSPRAYMLEPDLTTFFIPGNTYGDGTQLVVWTGASMQIPHTADFVDIQEGFIYYVVNATLEGFELSTTAGGPPLLFLSRTGGYVQQILPQVFLTAGTFAVSVIAIDATLGT